MNRLFIIFIISVITTACVPLWQQRPDVTPETLWDSRYSDLIQLEQWRIQGRTVITQGKEAWNAGLRWQENGDTYYIKLLGPFAQGGAVLEGDKDSVILTMADGQTFTSTSPEALIAETLGMALPISALRDWIRGMPYQQAESEIIEFDDQGRITHLIQQGWDIEFLRYIPFEQYSMPSKIFIKHSDLSLRLVINSWDSIP